MILNKTGLLIGASLLAVLLALPAAASDYTLGVFGNANEDDTINMQDVTYTELIILEYRDQTELADGKYDGKINMQDVTQIELAILGKEMELTFVDATGDAVTVNKPVTRMVTLPPSSLDTIRAIGAKDKVVGVSTYLDEVYFPELSALPSVGSSWFTPDYEAIIELEPDIVLTLGSYNPGIEDKIGPAGIVVVRMEFNRVDLLPGEIRKLGYILDTESEAEEFADWYEGWTDEVGSRADELSENKKPLVYMGYLSKAGGKDTLWDAACIMAGGINIAGGTGGYYEVDPEWVIEQSPDVIVKAVTTREASQGYQEDDPSQMEGAREDIMNQVGWENINAVKNGRVYVSAWQLHLGTHTVILISYMAKWLHPELFEDMDPSAIHQEYLKFQGLDYDLSENGVFVYPPLEAS